MKTLRTPALAGATWIFCTLALVTTTVAQTTITRIPTLGGSVLHVHAINRSGLLAGFSRTAADEEHACLYSGGVLHDLQTLGGPFSLATSLNDAGEVVGDSDTADGFRRAFVFRDGTMTDLGTLAGGGGSTAIAINNAGHVLGESDASDGYRGFIHRDGTMTDIGSLGIGFSSVSAVNNHGDVVGDSMTDMFETHAFVFRNGSMSDLRTLGGAYSSATAINDSGVIVGESRDANGELRAFGYSNGTMENLGTLGGTESVALAVNNGGDILGDSALAGDLHYRSFIFRNGTMTDLGTLGGNWNTAYDLNNLGDVVGEAETATGATLPFLWRDGTMTDLNTLLPPNSGWILLTAFHINDVGQVVGFGLHNGEFGWYLLSLGASANQPPVADAGADQTVECGSMTQLDGRASSDPEGDPLTFEWREGTTVLGYGAMLSVDLGLGAHTITLTVNDSHDTATDTLTVVVRDTTPPTGECAPAMTVSDGEPTPDFTAALTATDNCTPPDQLVKTQAPAAGTMMPAGSHDVTLTVADAAGNTSMCVTKLHVVEPARVVNCPAGVTANANAQGRAPVPDFTAHTTVSGNFSGTLVKTQVPAAGTRLGLGTHNVTVTVADDAENTASCTTTFTVVDRTAPRITDVSVNPRVIRRANGKLVPVTVSVRARDNCDPAPVSRILSITSDEPVTGPGDNTSPDWVVGSGLTAEVRAELARRGNGRVYTITVICTDASGNSSTATAKVRVPKDD